MLENTFGSELSRRGFIGATAAAGVLGMGALLSGTAVADEAAATEFNGAGANLTPELDAMGGTSLTHDEINARRHALVDSKGDFVGADGTTTPAVWNKLRALIDTYGWGYGSAKGGENSFAFLQMMFSEDEAQAYLEMPFGEIFTAAEFAYQSGRDEAECAQVCETLAQRGCLFRAVRGGVPYYMHIGIAQGFIEYNIEKYWQDGWLMAFVGASEVTDEEGGNQGWLNGTGFYRSIPCKIDVVGDEKILPFDSWEAVVERNEIIGLSPCQCRTINALLGGAADGIPSELLTEDWKDCMNPLCGHPQETCLCFGEEAQYYIDRGIARQITKDEARAVLQRSVDAGMVIQSLYTKSSEVLCSCHCDCCGILGAYVAVGPDAMANSPLMPNYSHYNLVYLQDQCIQCGACAERCPMHAITMGEEGYPEVDVMCVRCGQCATVCPASARCLMAKDPSEFIELPHDLRGDYDLKAGYRFEHGMFM